MSVEMKLLEMFGRLTETRGWMKACQKNSKRSGIRDQ